jgi:hypothetical protein
MMTWAARFRVRQHFCQSLWAGIGEPSQAAVPAGPTVA